MTPMLRAALRRPDNYAQLGPAEQWAIDKHLGILDWEPTPAEVAEYRRILQEREKAKKP